MYTFNDKGDFCVGNTTIESLFKVTVQNYEVELPEIHAFGPLMTPQSIKLAYIINWLERGLIVDFQNKEDEEKALFFIIEYNKYAKSVNDQEGKIVYKIAIVAQKFLMVDLKWESKKEDESNVKKENPFKKIIHNQPSQESTKKIYSNESVRAKFARHKNSNKNESLNKRFEIHGYDIFANTPQEPELFMDSSMNNKDFQLDPD